MFRATNADGMQVASYANASEMATWIKTIPEHQRHDRTEVRDDHNFSIVDKNGTVTYRISGPAPKEGESKLSDWL